MNDGTGNSGSSRRQVFLSLVRAPNLLSVPGDPLAGLFLALAAGTAASRLGDGAAQLWFRVLVGSAAAVAAYAGGLVDNDLEDLDRDRRERPERSLPSGLVSVRSASRLRLVLLALPFLLGVAARLPLAWFGGQFALLAAILAYNRVKRRMPVPGFFLMGLCRGLSLLSGALLLGPAALCGAPALWGAFALWTAYIAGMTAFASTETLRGSDRMRYALLLPFLPALLLGGACSWKLADPSLPALAAASASGALLAGKALLDCGPGAEPARVQRTVGRLIRVLFPMQACACLASSGGRWPALILLGCWLASDRMSRRYAAS